eukprot:4724453-Amphidinium_carterae.1
MSELCDVDGKLQKKVEMGVAVYPQPNKHLQPLQLSVQNVSCSVQLGLPYSLSTLWSLTV